MRQGRVKAHRKDVSKEWLDDQLRRRSLYNIALDVNFHLQGALISPWFVWLQKLEKEHEELAKWMINCVEERWEARTNR